ncbi:hypothetical protein C2S52_007209 [Perilla frutescens var. hirtella]|uniref:Uncharacterized protein n=1 Tax=Perilla frutescens var. hirtella TaxID=608512 RepID=A0AAD4IQI3_PERFH|nr:hypothetical protein C2S53_020887 [Perilla frutescens var. hirtella]KAH6777350.1 hypothetical protein C2S51_008662 [Perilla frutescens var. frutescens]KAH6787657.1 hypothetical protein C2S52_007209 [Perilla frutescens var. hirtella]
MGACASLPKAMRAKANNFPAPEPREEEISNTVVAEETTVAALENAEGGNDISPKKAAKVEAPKQLEEVVSNISKMEAPTPSKLAAAEDDKTPAAEQKND